MSFGQLYNETMFLLPQKPTNPAQIMIVLIHSINLNEGLVHVGLKEEDPIKELVGLAPGWDSSEDGIYSLKYQNKQQEIMQLKVVTTKGSPWVNIFAVKTNDDQKLGSYQLDTSKIDFQKFDPSSQSITQIIKAYKSQVLDVLFKEQQETKPIQQQTNIIVIEQPRNVPSGIFWNQPRNLIDDQPSSFGRSDLYPFSGVGFGGQGLSGQGGNLMGQGYFQQFGQQQQTPSFQVPPGARFDPFGPNPNINQQFQDPSKRRFPF